MMKNLTKGNKGESRITFDFVPVYTQMPHSKLWKVLYKLTDFCFDEGLHKYISVNRFGAKCVSNPDGYSLVFDKVSFKKAIKYVSDNCCFQFGSKVFQQVVGIPICLTQPILWEIIFFLL